MERCETTSPHFPFEEETMKTRLFILLVVFLLSACSNSTADSGNATITPDFLATDTANQIGTAVAARASEVALDALNTPTPTPGAASIQDLILSSAEANELANRWSDSPADDTASVNPEYCAIECISLIWEGGTGGNSTLDITLIKTGSRDEAATIFNELKASATSETTPEIPLPELVTLPEGTFIVNGQSQDLPVWGLITRRGTVVVLIGLNMPDLSEDENILFLSLFADRQIQKLIAAGH
jgi:hypothetical protein